MEVYDAVKKLTLAETLEILTYEDLADYFAYMEYPPLELIKDKAVFLQNQIDEDELDVLDIQYYFLDKVKSVVQERLDEEERVRDEEEKLREEKLDEEYRTRKKLYDEKVEREERRLRELELELARIKQSPRPNLEELDAFLLKLRSSRSPVPPPEASIKLDSVHEVFSGHSHVFSSEPKMVEEVSNVNCNPNMEILPAALNTCVVQPELSELNFEI